MGNVKGITEMKVMYSHLVVSVLHKYGATFLISVKYNVSLLMEIVCIGSHK